MKQSIISKTIINYADILRLSVLFSGMTDEDLAYALTFFNAAEETFHKDAFLHRGGEPMLRFGFVLTGTVQVLMDDLNGNQMIMANVSAGGTFGESLHFLKIPDSVVYIIAGSDCRILWLSAENVFRPDAPHGQPHGDLSISHSFVSLLASKTLELNDRIQVLSKLTIRDKLITYFSQCLSRYGGLSFTVPFDRKKMAVYLGVDRSSLSRELMRMRDEGLISFDRDRFKLLKTSSFKDRYK